MASKYRAGDPILVEVGLASYPNGGQRYASALRLKAAEGNLSPSESEWLRRYQAKSATRVATESP